MSTFATMDCTKKVDHGKSTLGAFSVLPPETIQEFMSYLDPKTVVRVASLSSAFHNSFKRAQGVIAYQIIVNELGPREAKAATARYASTIPDLKESLSVLVVKSRTNPIAARVQLGFNTFFLDVTRFSIPKTILTLPIAQKIIKYHERVVQLSVNYYEYLKESWESSDASAESPGWVHPFVTNAASPRERLMQKLAVYVADIARHMFPEEYRDDQQTHLVSEDYGEHGRSTFKVWFTKFPFVNYVTLGRLPDPQPDNQPPFEICVAKLYPKTIDTLEHDEELAVENDRYGAVYADSDSDEDENSDEDDTGSLT
ncbi:hypothetical protein GGR54DRAFT_350863 [Hypoxylon sp. NC1633]|nr:hypothetical protein GGR54DRAFT_350863 [Hypoxylon sp. NC1633]